MVNKSLEYDAVIIGAGNGGLAAAVRLAKNQQKVLLIEKHNLPGGFATSFVRGRFEFDASLHELGAIGTKTNPGYVLKLFNDYGININWCAINEAFCLYLKQNDGTDKVYSLPFCEQAFAKKVDQYEPNSYDEVIRFLSICKELYDCSMYLTSVHGNSEAKILKKHFPDFLTTGTYTLQQVLDQFKLSNTAKAILSAYWVYLGLAPNELDFCLYANMFAEYIYFGAYIPQNRSNEISTKLITKFIELGGEVWFNCVGEKIDVVNNQIQSLTTSKGVVKTKHIISNISPNSVYGGLIDQSNVNEYENKLGNYRQLNRQGFCIYVGLDIDAKILGLNQYSYFMFSDVNQNICANKLKSIETNKEYVVVVLNNANENCSPKNSSILTFTTLYDDAWNNIDQSQYFILKEKIAKMIIEDFQERLKVNIMNHIEEIEIATPVTFARYTSALNGNIYGYAPTSNDGVIVRSANMDKEVLIKGLVFAGGYAFRCHGYSTTYMSGEIAGLITYGEIMKGNK